MAAKKTTETEPKVEPKVETEVETEVEINKDGLIPGKILSQAELHEYLAKQKQKKRK